MEKTKITYEALVDKYGFEKIVYDSEETGYGFEFKKTMDKYCELVIADDFSFGLNELVGRDCLCFENDILDSCERLELIWKALTGRDII